MDKLKSAALLAACSTTLSGQVMAQVHGHPSLSPVVCNQSGKYPTNGDKATLIIDGNFVAFVPSNDWGWKDCRIDRPLQPSDKG